MNYKGYCHKLFRKMADDDYRYYVQLQILCTVIGVISLLMGVMNIFTRKTVLMIATLSFSALCFLNFFILRYVGRVNSFCYGIFESSVLVLFTYFLLTGGTAGFSPHWILLLPACGFILLGFRRGWIMNAIMLSIMLFLLWLPYGNSFLLYNYSREFLMRFPVAYISFLAIGWFFEFIHRATQHELLEARAQIAVQAETDALTKLKNRYWFNEKILSGLSGKTVMNSCAALMIDVDNFKLINDTYGHQTGDKALVCVADVLSACFDESARLCRWGGEEFFAFLPACSESEASALGESVRTAMCKINVAEIKASQTPLTVSVGIVSVPAGTVLDFNLLFSLVDKQLYIAKNSGKNRCVMTVLK